MGNVNIAVIGGGIAGLACASELVRGEAKVTLFEGSRGLGGRLGTSRHGNYAFDHGAQFVTARSRPFLKYVEVAGRAGTSASWKPRVVEDGRRFDGPIEDWYVGTPGMSAFIRPLSRGVELQRGVAVHELVQSQRGWELQTNSGRENRIFDAVAVAVPAPQAHTLLGPHGRTFRFLSDVRMAPCWTAMMTFERPFDPGGDAFRWTTGPLTWAACDSSKPQRTSSPPSWVVHASAQWSRDHLDADVQGAALLLLRELGIALGIDLPHASFLMAHRWRHALVEQVLGLPCIVDEEIAAGACGDWCIAPRVEAAFESGRTLAHSMLPMVGLSPPLSRG